MDNIKTVVMKHIRREMIARPGLPYIVDIVENTLADKELRIGRLSKYHAINKTYEEANRALNEMRRQ